MSNKSFIKSLNLFLLLIFAGTFSFAEKTTVPNLYEFTLNNGLELFVLEDDSAPLAYIEIAVKCGGIHQTKENAGLFHLYEHMMFKGNKKFKTQKEVTQEMNSLGVASWNGSTGIDRVNYYFTVPSNLLKRGLEFWSYAVRFPLLDEKEFENEKKVVVSEIEGGLTEPNRILFAKNAKELFPQSPWKLDPSGSPDTIKNATLEDLKFIKDNYYIPSNSAVFVGGDVKADQVYSLVKRIFGGWKNPSSNLKNETVSPSKSPLKSIKKIVFPHDSISGEFSKLIYTVRGPDAQSDGMDIYGAELWSWLMDNPENSFTQMCLGKKEFNIPDAQYIAAGYSMARASGLINLCAVMENDDFSPVLRTDSLLDFWLNECVYSMADKTKAKENGYGSDDILKIMKLQEDAAVFSMETPSATLKLLSSCWASAGKNYFFNYSENTKKIKDENICTIVEKYLKNTKGTAILLVNPEVYKNWEQDFTNGGWEILDEKNCRWWNE